MREDLGPQAPIDGATAICTLFEGDYHLGLAAFVNSLVRSGYKGTVWAGYRGQLPPWLNQLTRIDPVDTRYLVANQIRLSFLRLDTDIHLANYKPHFMQRVLTREASDCEYLWYFDPDIFLRCKWSHFAKWQRYGVALCEEITNYNLAERDPLRLEWMEIGAAMGLCEPHALSRYFNSGMVGLGPSHIDLLEIWQKILQNIGTSGIDLKSFMPGNRDSPFHSLDQDALNMAVMYAKHPLTTMGPEAMGFVPSGFTMFHAVAVKPWRGSLLSRALRGFPPSNAAKFFFAQSRSPIRAYSPSRFLAKRIDCAVAAFIGRFYSRR